MNNRILTIILLAASALLLLLEISIFIAVIPQNTKFTSLEQYKSQVNSSLSDQQFIQELIDQNLMQKQTIDLLEAELADENIVVNNILNRLNFSAGVEINPFRRISREDIQVYGDRVVIYVNKAFTAGFSNSKSMYPFISEDAYALEIKPATKDELKPGDIIGFASASFNTTIIHRIVETGEDDNGWFAVTKGDNNPLPDPDKIRFDDIKGVLIGLIY